MLVGSRNPVKIGAVQDVFEQYFPGIEVQGIEVPSGVPAQPVGDDTFAGAQNRALALVALNRGRDLGADYCAGLEGGIAAAGGALVRFRRHLRRRCQWPLRLRRLADVRACARRCSSRCCTAKSWAT